MRKVGTMQGLLDQHLNAMPQLLFDRAIEEKLSAAGIEMPQEVRAQFVDHLIGRNPTPFIWDDGGPDRQFTLDFTEEDFKKVLESAESFNANLPDVIHGLSQSLSRSVLTSLDRKWHDEHTAQFIERDEFRANLEDRWGRGLNSLRMMLTCSREIGAEFTKKNPKKLDLALHSVLVRLHIRACKTTDEIITLLENGLSDGAISRWRTLHEISVVGTLISTFGNDIAQRYIDHLPIEAKRAANAYEAARKFLGLEAISDQEKAGIDTRFRAALSKYGADFGGSYGWAQAFLNAGRNPNFSDLEKAAGAAAMRPYYKMASYNVHAAPHSLFQTLGMIGDSSIVTAGASNAGLMEPGRLTARVHTQIIFLLFREPFSFDDIVHMHVLMRLRDRAIRAFERADKKLERDEKEHQRKKRVARDKARSRRSKSNRS